MKQIKTLALRAGLTIILVTIGALIGKTALIVFTAFALLLNLGMYFFSDRLVLEMHGALAFVAPFAATLVQLGISRSREFMADQTGAQICHDPEALASALEKLERAAAIVPPASSDPTTASLFIVNPLTGVEGLVRLFSTHPSTRERVRRLRAMPRGRLAFAA